MSQELDAVEMKRAMETIAEVSWGFYSDLRKQGFLQADAMRLTAAWLTATIRGSAGSDEA